MTRAIRRRRITGLDFREHRELAAYAAYALGQLRALSADHRINLEFPGMAQCLPKEQIARGLRHAERWLADYEQ
jgi:hypothetical protein